MMSMLRPLLSNRSGRSGDDDDQGSKKTRAAEMIDDLEFQRIRAKFRASGTIDDELYRLLVKLVGAVIFGGTTPRSLSPTGVWDEHSAQDAAHDWMTKRLLNPQNNSLLAAFDHGVSTRKFLNSLELSFRSHLKSQAVRSELDNLDRRAGRLLRTDDRFREWIPQTVASRSWWGLSEWEDPTPFRGRDSELASAAWALGEVALLRYRAGVDRASPVVSTAALAAFIAALLGQVKALLTRQHLRRVFEKRFGLSEMMTVPLEDTDIAQEAEEPEFSDEELAALSELVLVDMSERQARALKLRAAEATLEAIAGELNVSRGTADNELRRVGTIISGYVADETAKRRLLEIVISRLS